MTKYMPKNQTVPNRRAFTLVELCVVIGIIALLLALAIPAIMRSREASLKIQCKDRLRQITMACLGYESAHRHLPHSYIPKALPIALLPFLEQQSLYTNLVSRNGDHYEASVEFSPPGVYLCPSDSMNSRPGPHNRRKLWAMNYVANSGTGLTRAGYDGLFGVAMNKISLREISDGLSNTSVFSECLVSGADLSEPHRLIFHLPFQIGEPERFAELIDAIATAHLWGASYSPYHGRGRPWTDHNDQYRVFHHALGPNSNSGFNGGSVQGGLYSTASNHPSSVNLAFVDGSVTSINNEITPEVWWAMGSRAGGEIAGE